MPIGPGSRLGPYEITALIGEGGMGKVWRAHHTAQWAKSGRELFYGGLDSAMMSVRVETTPTFSFGKAAKLFQWPTARGAPAWRAPTTCRAMGNGS